MVSSDIVEGDELTDHDRDVDGGAGGTASGGGGPASPSAPSDRRSARMASDGGSAKVVPFPGNWFGAVEDLVPIHPEPVPAAPESVPLRAEPARPVVEVASPPVESSSTSAADASDFWEGDAATLQQVPAVADSLSSIGLLRSPAAPSRKPSARSGAADPLASGQPEGRAAAPSAGSRRRGVWRPAFVALLGAVVIGGAVLAMNLVSDGATSGTVRHPGGTATVAEHRPPAATDTITSTVTVTTKAKPRRRRHHVNRVAGTKTTTVEVNDPSAGAGDSADSSSGAPPTGTVSSGSTAPAPSSGTASGGSSGAGSGCVQSPDSGCLP